MPVINGGDEGRRGRRAGWRAGRRCCAALVRRAARVISALRAPTLRTTRARLHRLLLIWLRFSQLIRTLTFPLSVASHRCSQSPSHPEIVLYERDWMILLHVQLYSVHSQSTVLVLLVEIYGTDRLGRLAMGLESDDAALQRPQSGHSSHRLPYSTYASRRAWRYDGLWTLALG